MTSKGHKLSQEALVAPAFLCSLGKASDQLPPSFFPGEQGAVSSDGTQQERNRERWLASSHDDYEARIHMYWERT